MKYMAHIIENGVSLLAMLTLMIVVLTSCGQSQNKSNGEASMVSSDVYVPREVFPGVYAFDSTDDFYVDIYNSNDGFTCENVGPITDRKTAIEKAKIAFRIYFSAPELLASEDLEVGYDENADVWSIRTEPSYEEDVFESVPTVLIKGNGDVIAAWW